MSSCGPLGCNLRPIVAAAATLWVGVPSLCPFLLSLPRGLMGASPCRGACRPRGLAAVAGPSEAQQRPGRRHLHVYRHPCYCGVEHAVRRRDGIDEGGAAKMTKPARSQSGSPCAASSSSPRRADVAPPSRREERVLCRHGAATGARLRRGAVLCDGEMPSRVAAAPSLPHICMPSAISR